MLSRTLIVFIIGASCASAALAAPIEDRRTLIKEIGKIGKVEPLVVQAAECSDGLVASVGGKENCLKVGQEFADCDDCPVMAVIPAGSFIVGSPKNEKERAEDEGPQRTVTIAKPFAVGRFEVTFNEWDDCAEGGGCGGYRPEDFWGRGKHPVINVSWDEAQAYLAWLSDKTGAGYRLLSEAEWEYAARAGTTTPFSTGNTVTSDRANFDGNSTYDGSKKGKYREKPVPTGSFDPNQFGLYDMHGNVMEWVQDSYRESYEGAPDDGTPREEKPVRARVIRGGGWYDTAAELRSANRFRVMPVIGFNPLGFRVARPL